MRKLPDLRIQRKYFLSFVLHVCMISTKNKYYCAKNQKAVHWFV